MVSLLPSIFIIQILKSQTTQSIIIQYLYNKLKIKHPCTTIYTTTTFYNCIQYRYIWYTYISKYISYYTFHIIIWVQKKNEKMLRNILYTSGTVNVWKLCSSLPINYLSYFKYYSSCWCFFSCFLHIHITFIKCKYIDTENVVYQVAKLVEKVSIIYELDYIIIFIKKRIKTRLRQLIHKCIQNIQILYNTRNYNLCFFFLILANKQ